MDNYTPNPFITQPIYDPTRPFATPNHPFAKENVRQRDSELLNVSFSPISLVLCVAEE